MNDTLKVLGHTFRPFDKTDWDGFAGAEEGSYICHLDDVTLIWDPKNRILSEMYEEDGDTRQNDWTSTII